MKGGMDFRQALAIRLDLIRPSSSQLRNYIYSQKHRLTPYVKYVISFSHMIMVSYIFTHFLSQ